MTHYDRDQPYGEDQRRRPEGDMNRDHSGRDSVGRRDHWNDSFRSDDRGARANHPSRPHAQRDSYDPFSDESSRRAGAGGSFGERSGSSYGGGDGPTSGSYGRGPDSYDERPDQYRRGQQSDSLYKGPLYENQSQRIREARDTRGDRYGSDTDSQRSSTDPWSGRSDESRGRRASGGSDRGSRSRDSRAMSGGYSGDDSGYGYGGGARGYGGGGRGYGGLAQTGSNPGAGFGSSMGLQPESGSRWSAGPHTGKGPKGYRRSDEKLIEEACQLLERHGDVDASEIEVTCESGMITLQGTVDSRRSKRAAEEAVEQVYGVHDVTNQLKVERESSSDKGQSSASKSSEASKSDSSRASSSGTASPASKS